MSDKQASAGAEGGASAPERKKPQKLGQKKPQQQQPTPDQSEGDGGAEAEASADVEADASANADGEEEAEPEPQQQKSRQASQSRRRQSRGRGRRGQDSDTESVARSDASANGGRRQRQRQKKQGGGGGGGPLDDITENVPGGDAIGGAGEMVQNTAGQAVNQVGNTAGKALGGLTGGQKQGGGEEEDDGGKGEQLRLRLELNLDIEIQLKAKIHGDLTLGLLYVYRRTSLLNGADNPPVTKTIAATHTPKVRTTNAETTFIMGYHGVLVFVGLPSVHLVSFPVFCKVRSKTTRGPLSHTRLFCRRRCDYASRAQVIQGKRLLALHILSAHLSWMPDPEVSVYLKTCTCCLRYLRIRVMFVQSDHHRARFTVSTLTSTCQLVRRSALIMNSV
ncbi:hypothetical protein AUEXF2481DRAFT_547143 [Aureobasidium subglaciale EXF-2481]|uniref:Uncharacterized protein n=1 Tax=Aureobasidium subglaciale (strain EXF-2481) TaxID=1043005 RepID=A0A074YJ17_AURSE|nr:uncharacterized protein AUEXF2481DRAFT_547143 [Aureobasidium subglaciale EXF-2481]KEQ97798.1 hypothetical protein AUEXF2481DRAFT_547143 [Aureobasidium subglaciale EXF-2481]